MYSRKDLVLSYIFRAAELFAQPIGNQPLELEKISVVNIDVTDSVGGHQAYKNKLSYILDRIKGETGQSISDFDSDTISLQSSASDMNAENVTQEIIKILNQVPGMTNADPLDFDESEIFIRCQKNLSIRTWKNVFGVDHVFIEKNGKCIFGGYVGWVHSDGLHAALKQIKRRFSGKS